MTAVVGTAGHIDHGKTTLVKALTGRDTDTLDEEIRRGITINPGFTWLSLDGGLRAGLIDVPGHERFIKNMIAGAVGIDFAMLVVAANDGVKPQTLEHLWILETLSLKGGIVALTKCGLADEMMIELCCDEISDMLKGTFMEGAAIIRVDSISGQGIPELRAALEAAVLTVVKDNTQKSKALARLNIDRVFTKKGFGAVVTGTLAEGGIGVGDDLVLYPQNKPCKARGIQVHESAAERVLAGSRAAINLSGVRAGDIRRGDILAAGEMRGADFVDVKLRLFPKASRGVKFWDRLRLYIGTRELFCRAVPLLDKAVAPGEEAFCQLRLEERLYCKKDDRFVVRTYSPMETIGGGVIIDPNPAKHSRMDEALLAALTVKEEGEESDLLADYVKSNPGATLGEIEAYLARDMAALDALLTVLLNDRRLFKLADGHYHENYVEELYAKALAVLETFHRANPLKRGMSKEELKSKLSSSFDIKNKALEAALAWMENDGLLRGGAGMVALHAFEVRLTPKQQAAKEHMLAALLAGGYMPPSVAELCGGDKSRSDLLPLFTEVIFLDKSTVMHVKYYDAAKISLREYLSANAEITLAAFRDMLGTSRKYAQLMLEHFDDTRLTVRVGDARKLR